MTRAALSVAFFLLPAPSLFAQQTSILLGGVYARYADSLDGGAGVFSARLLDDDGLMAGRLEGSYSQFTGGGWAVQVGGSGAAFSPWGQQTLVGITAGANASRVQGGSWVGSLAAGPGAVVQIDRSLLSLSGSLGRVKPLEAAEMTFGSVAAGARFASSASLSWSGSAVATWSPTIDYGDFGGGVRYQSDVGELSLVGGVRVGDLSGGWVAATGERRFGQVTLEASAGRYPRDLVGFTDGVFAWAGVRLSTRGGSRRTAPAPEPAVTVTRMRRGAVRIVVRQVEAKELAIAGEWNGWTPEPLTRSDSGWMIVVALDEGVYRYSIVVNGTEWTVPPGAVTVPDEFGGRVAILVVPPEG